MGAIYHKRILMVGINPDFLCSNDIKFSEVDSELLEIIRGKFNGVRPIVSVSGSDPLISNSCTITIDDPFCEDTFYFEDCEKPLLVYFPDYFDIIIVNLEVNIKISHVQKLDLFDNSQVYFINYGGWEAKSLRKYYKLDKIRFMNFDDIMSIEPSTGRCESLVLDTDDVEKFSQDDLSFMMLHQLKERNEEIAKMREELAKLKLELKEKDNAISALDNIRKMLKC